MQLVKTTVRLWTFQHHVVSDELPGQKKYFPSWSNTPDSSNLAYKWMLDQYNKLIVLSIETPLVWCWHSCEEVFSPPTVGTANALLSEYDINQGMVVIQLDVPADTALLSSYYEWNRFLDDCYEQNAIPVSSPEWQNMFSVPPITHEFDSIQAIIPYIDCNWVNAIWPLRVFGRKSSEYIIE